LVWRNLINYKKKSHLQRSENPTAKGDAVAENHVERDAPIRDAAPTKDVIGDNKTIN
jgi:hypothetical protein